MMSKKKKIPFGDRIAAFVSWFGRLLYPPQCVACDEVLIRDSELCSVCIEHWKSLRRSRCPVCQKTARACTCFLFHTTNTDAIGERKLSSLAFYTKFNPEEPDPRNYMLMRLVQNVKTSPDRSTARFCARELSHDIMKLLLTNGFSPEQWKITYPPRSKKRAKFYGFDHGRDLAQMISEYTGIAFEETIINSGKTAQKHLNSLERKQNADKSYSLKPGCTPSGNYLIVDDIVTTGATVSAAASILKNNGADLVYPVAIARTKNKKRKLRRLLNRPWFKMK